MEANFKLSVVQGQAHRAILAAFDGPGTSLTQVAEEAASWAQRILRSDGATVTQVLGDHYEYVAAIGVTAELKGRRLKSKAALNAAVIEDSKPLTFGLEDAPASTRTWAKSLGVESGMIAPLVVRNRTVGTLGVTSRRPKAFKARDAQMLRELADFLALALALNQARDLRSHFTAEVVVELERERQRIARELHDETGQSMTALVVRLKLLEDAAPSGPLRRELGELRALTARSVTEIGRLARGLRSSAITSSQLQLDGAIRRCAEECAARHGFRVDTRLEGLEGAARLPGDVELALYRIVQEALTNAAKHARASVVSVMVHREARRVRLVIEDDGKGVSPAAKRRKPASGGLGLAGIRERVALLDGQFTLESARGRGTALYVELPLREGA